MSRCAADAWTRYWAGGEVSSLPQGYGDPLRGPLAEFWRRRLAQLRESQALFAAAGSVLEVSAAAAPARAQLSAWNALGRELLRLERLAEAHPERWPVATLREVPAAIRDLLTAAVPEPGATVDAGAAQRCRRSLTDFARLLAAHAERLAALLAAAPDRAAVERLLRCAQRRDLLLIERTDLRDRTGLMDRARRHAGQGPLLAHAIILRRLPASWRGRPPVSTHVLG